MTSSNRPSSARPFYESALSEAERAALPAALDVEGVDEEIALLRLRLRSVLKEDPAKVDFMLKGLERLARMVATRYGLERGDKQGLSAFARETARRLRQREEAGDDA